MTGTGTGTGRGGGRRRWGGLISLLLVLGWVLRAVPVAAAPPPSQPGATEGAPPTDASPAGADPAEAAPTGTDPSQAALAKALRTRSEQVDALIAGTLDPSVDVDALFTIHLVSPELGGSLGGMRLLELLRELQQARAAVGVPGADGEAPAIQEPPPAPEGADELTKARAELARAYWRFLLLPVARRDELLADHARRRAAIDARQVAELAARARITELKTQAEQLAALIDGTIDPDVDLQPLLRLDLADARELTGDDDRLRRALGLASKPEAETGEAETGEAETGEAKTGEAKTETGETESGGAESGEAESGEAETGEAEADLDPALVVELQAAAAALDTQRMRLLALEPAQRQALVDDVARRKAEAEAPATDEGPDLLETEAQISEAVETQISEAEDAAAKASEARQKALLAASQARTEAIRRLAEEQARLLGVQESHALLRATLTRRKQDILAAHEIALEWEREVRRVETQVSGPETEAEADALYFEVRDALRSARDRLRVSLAAVGASEVEPVGEPLRGLPEDIDQGELTELRREIAAAGVELQTYETEVNWSAAERGRDDIVLLNRARLALLEAGSSAQRRRVTGFGIDGVEQVRREFDQIGLELRFRLKSLPRLGRTLLARFEASPLPVIFGVLQLGLILLAFRFWRRRADATLGKARDYFRRRKQGSGRVNGLMAALLWYLGRVRKPLEVLVLLAAMFSLMPDGEVLELEVLWLISLWVLVGLALILFVDAIAARDNLVYGGSAGTATLRIRSLRLVGLTVVFTGLILSLTEQTVGRGAIHHWVGTLMWFAALPIVLLLIHWWRVHAFARMRDQTDLPDNALTRWIRGNTDGVASFPAAAVAGAYLFGRGVARWLLHRATALESTRRVLAWMFRREVARQANARKDDGEATPLPAEVYTKFDPSLGATDLASLGPAMTAVAGDIIAQIAALKVSQRGTISAVIGERGAGKSTLLRRLAADLEARAGEYVHTEASDGDPGEPGEPGEPSEIRHVEYGKLTVRRIQCPPGGFAPLQRKLAGSLGLSEDADVEAIVDALSDQTPLIFLIDDVHRLVRPAIGGLEGLDHLADFARQVRGEASWVMTIGAAAWQYISRARGERVFFDQVLRLAPWTEQQIGALIKARSAQAGVTAGFEDIVIPRQFDVATLGDGGAGQSEHRPSEAERAELGFYRILWDYAKGNPAVALHFWRESLQLHGAGDQARIKVRLFKEPVTTALDEVGPTIHFVLRAVVQLEVASPSDLVACTQLPLADVGDALRYALARGWIAQVGDDRYRVTWHWYRAIVNLLRRQHLLEI